VPGTIWICSGKSEAQAPDELKIGQEIGVHKIAQKIQKELVRLSKKTLKYPSSPYRTKRPHRMEPITLAIIGAAVYGAYRLSTAKKAALTAAVAPTNTPAPGQPVGLAQSTAASNASPPTGLPPGMTATAPATSAPAPKYILTGAGLPVPVVNANPILAPNERKASSPDFQWYFVVSPNQSPAAIAKMFTGFECGDKYGYIQLLDANPTKTTTGERSCYKINFKSLLPGETLKIPRAWNVFISEDGVRRNDTPWVG
jgi:hypothetical protein